MSAPLNSPGLLKGRVVPLTDLDAANVTQPTHHETPQEFKSMFKRLCRAFEETLRAPPDAERNESAASDAMANLRLDYQTTVQQFTVLADIRFKLLAFVPTVTGAAFALLKDSPNKAATAAIGLFGFLVTLGIIFYEIRNTQFYDRAVHRAKALEAGLKDPLCAARESKGGFFSARESEKLGLFGFIPIWHDLGLAIVYGSTLAAWTLLVFHAGLTSQTGQRYFASIAGRPNLMSAMVAAVIGFVFAWQIILLSKKGKPSSEPPDGDGRALQPNSREEPR